LSGLCVVGEFDLRKIDRDRDASIESLIPQLSVTRCSPQPPFARPVGLFETEWQNTNRPIYAPKPDRR